MKKTCDRTEKYRCIGENFIDTAQIGDCGDVRSLNGWLVHLSHKDEAFLESFFDGYTNKEVASYIYANWGKRLEKAE